MYEGKKADEMPNGIDEELIEYGWEEDIWYVCEVEKVLFGSMFSLILLAP